MGAIALIDVLARDGSVRQSLKVAAWPLRIGRAIDNHLVLDDPHIAAHHLSIDTNEDGVFIAVGDTLNGVRIGPQQLASGERWQAGAEPLLMTLGHTLLRLRLAEHTLPPEQPLRMARQLVHGMGSLVVLMLLMAAYLAADTYLSSDSEGHLRALATATLGLAAVVLTWCGAWTLLSKLFTHQGHFTWHLRVALVGVLLLEASTALTQGMAFAFSAPWVSDFNFAPLVLILSAVLYFHLQAVEPHRRRLTRALALGCAVGGIGLTLWFNWQRTEQWGSELYMSHLRPPSWRVAPAAELDGFMRGVQALQPQLDRKAKSDTRDTGDSD
jgi:hypothetical protein